MDFDMSWTMSVLVFLAEMCVVTLGTIRIIVVARGMKKLATLLGFFEVLIWLFAIRQIMNNLSDMRCFFAFASGFATGNYLGMLVHEKLALGNSVVQMITQKDSTELIRRLSNADFGVTTIAGEGASGPVRIIYSIVKRKDVGRITQLIKDYDPRAFFAIDEVQTVNHGIFPLSRRVSEQRPLAVLFERLVKTRS